MQMDKLNSSNLESAGHDIETGALRVQFKNGGLYEYHGVPEGVHQDLMTAPSPGSFYAASIKKRFESNKICATCYGEIEAGTKGNFCSGDSCAADAGDHAEASNE